MFRLSLALGVLVTLSSLMVPGADAGMKSWWDNMWGNGKGKGKGKGRQQQSGPIYLTAPPLYAHAPHHYKSHGIHHGYGGHDQHSFGGSYGAQGVISHGNSIGYGGDHSVGLGGHGLSGGSGLAYEGGHELSGGYGGGLDISSGSSLGYGGDLNIGFGGHAISSGSSLGYGGPDISSGSSLGYGGHGISSGSSLGYGGDFSAGNGGHDISSGNSFGYDHHDDSFLQHSAVGSYSEGHEFVPKPHSGGVSFSGGFESGRELHSAVGSYSGPKEVEVTIQHEVPQKTRYGSNFNSNYGSNYGKQHGFGPIKDDDLIIMQKKREEAAKIEQREEKSVVLPIEEFVQEVSEVVHHGSSEEQSSYVETESHSVVHDQTPTPVYKAGSNSVGDSYAGHALDDGAVAALVQHGVSSASSDEAFSAPLPMAEHGTSSLTYLGESPFQAGSEAQGRSFEPSDSIPHPERHTQNFEHDVASGPETSYSTPHVVTASADYSGAGTSSKAVVTYDTPLNYNDPIIEIVFQDAEPSQYQPTYDIDPSLYEQQVTDDVEVYFIEVSDDKKLDSIDDLDLSQALAGVKKEFPEGLPSELTEKLRSSGYLGNANIEVVDMDQALNDNSLDEQLRSALQGSYGSSSNNFPSILKPEVPYKKSTTIDYRLRKLLTNKNVDRRNQNVARALKKYPEAVYGGIVESEDGESDGFLPVTVDGDRVPLPWGLQSGKKSIDTVLVYADETEKSGAKVLLSTEPGNRRTPRHIVHNNARLESWGQNNWNPIL